MAGVVADVVEDGPGAAEEPPVGASVAATRSVNIFGQLVLIDDSAKTYLRMLTCHQPAPRALAVMPSGQTDGLRGCITKISIPEEDADNFAIGFLRGLLRTRKPTPSPT
jgi:hypothetical protein